MTYQKTSSDLEIHDSIWYHGWLTMFSELEYFLSHHTQMLHGAGICTNIYPKNHPDVGKYTIHGASGIVTILWVVGSTTLRCSESIRLVHLSKHGDHGPVHLLKPARHLLQAPDPEPNTSTKAQAGWDFHGCCIIFSEEDFMENTKGAIPTCEPWGFTKPYDYGNSNNYRLIGNISIDIYS